MIRVSKSSSGIFYCHFMQTARAMSTLAIQKSSTKMRTLEPDWNEELVISCVTSSSYLTLTVLDKDLITLQGSDFLGQVISSLATRLSFFRY